jgi:plastocyanin
MTWGGRSLVGVAAAIVAAGVLAAATASPPQRQSAGITLHLFQFKPAVLALRVGERVTWTNQDDIPHTVTSGTPEDRDGRFAAPLGGRGAAFSFSFDQAGSYRYCCDRHPSMRGEIRVR